jgi:thiamine-monophosphate kinase
LNSPGSTGAPLVADLGERALIERIRRRVPPPPDSVLIGIGDDAAVAVPERGALEVITTDALVEGVHFDRRFSSAADVGFKAIAVNASDIAAMGGRPRLALLSLILPPELPASAVEELVDGVLEMTAMCRAVLVGGNIARSPGPLVVDVVMTGSVKPRKVLTRSGGRPGDVLYVTGAIGAAAAGLGWLRSRAGAGAPGLEGEIASAGVAWTGTAGQASPASSDAMGDCVARHRRPEPRLRVGALLGRNRAASACIDLSDGLADAVHRIAEASGTGATIDAAALPVHAAAREWFTATAHDPVLAGITGGDDYELLFAVPARARGRFRSVVADARGLTMTRIGELTADRAVHLMRDGRAEPLPAGFTHF